MPTHFAYLVTVMPHSKRPKSVPEKRGPGRPKTSDLDPISQARERQRRRRERARDSGRVAVQLWIDAKWHKAILKGNGTLQDAADEAFALLMAKRARKAR